MSRDWRDGEDFNKIDQSKVSSNGRKQERREKRHETKHHLRDLKDMLNGGEDIFDAMEDIEEEDTKS